MLNRELQLRYNSLKLQLGLVERMIIRAKLQPETLEVLHHVPRRFSVLHNEKSLQPFKIGDKWGSKNQYTYFRATFKIPSYWSNDAVELCMQNNPRYLEHLSNGIGCAAGPESQVFVNGKRMGAFDREHNTLRLPAMPGEKLIVDVIAYAARVECSHELEICELRRIDLPTDKLYNNLRVALEILEEINVESSDFPVLFHAVDNALKALDKRAIPYAGLDDMCRDPEGQLFYSSVDFAQKVFDSGISELPRCNTRMSIAAVGHAHIDLAWLWPIHCTHHKLVHTFGTQCRLLEQYDNWIFSQSSPQVYEWLEHDAPELFERICNYIKAGRWEAEGAMWCEADTNLTSGESLVRQLLYGKKYFMEKLGVDSQIVWLPDVFGYSAALPQIMRLAGVKAFVTSKISWSELNQFPFDSFRWRGIDGSEIPCHFITTPGDRMCIRDEKWFRTYTSKMELYEVIGSLKNYRQQKLGLMPLMPFGYGDGGGGVTERMLETAERLAGPLSGLDEVPSVKFTSVLKAVEPVIAKAPELPVWDQELYLEFHRGTYTTQGWLKRANRKNEISLHNAEWLSVLAGLFGYRRDNAKLDAIWKDLLLCQFHDILPGSSVNEVYEDEVRPMENKIMIESAALSQQAMDFICSQIDTSAMSEPVVLFNTLGWTRNDPVRLPDGTWRNDVIIPAGGWMAIDAAVSVSVQAPPQILDDGKILENKFWRLEFNPQGYIVSLYDKRAGIDVLAAGAIGNEWQVFEDRPANDDAWNIDLTYQEHPLPGPELMSMNVTEESFARAAIEIKWLMPKIGNGQRSMITQQIALYSNCERIDFETTIDWHEHHQLLKVAFPVRIRAHEASYQIQFGHIRRPTHHNTSWDKARFETCAHQFVDLAEDGYGIALLNDCKYGHDIFENTIRLTCIKSPQMPDPLADQGLHEFTYSLLPHQNSLQDAGVVCAAAELNTPIIGRIVPRTIGRLPEKFQLFSCDSDAVVIDTLKPSEDSRGLIMRLYESHGSHVQTKIRLAVPIKSAEYVDLLEQTMANEVNLRVTSEELTMDLHPFQLVTLKIIISDNHFCPSERDK